MQLNRTGREVKRRKAAENKDGGNNESKRGRDEQKERKGTGKIAR